MDFRLQVFVSVAKSLSFTKAAQELFVSQPAVTKHIRELESHYGVRLFERMGSRITLTDSGRTLLDHAQRILDDYNRLDYEMNLFRNGHTGHLRIGASTTIAQYVLPPYLSAFVRRFSQVSVTLLNDNSIGVENALRDHRINLGLVEGRNSQPNLHYSPFMDDELVLVAHAKSRWAKLDELTLEELRKAPLVLRENGSGTLDIIRTSLEQHGLKLSDMHVQMYLGSTETIKRFLETSDCLGIISIHAINRELASG